MLEHRAGWENGLTIKELAKELYEFEPNSVEEVQACFKTRSHISYIKNKAPIKDEFGNIIKQGYIVESIKRNGERRYAIPDEQEEFRDVTDDYDRRIKGNWKRKRKVIEEGLEWATRHLNETERRAFRKKLLERW